MEAPKNTKSGSVIYKKSYQAGVQAETLGLHTTEMLEHLYLM